MTIMVVLVIKRRAAQSGIIPAIDCAFESSAGRA